MLLIIVRFKNRIISVISEVNHIDLTCLGIREHKELVIQEIHLKDSFLNIHRTHLELFVLDDLIIIIFRNRLCKCFLESCILELFLYLGLVLADLSDDLINSVIKSYVLIFSRTLCARGIRSS